MNYTPFHVHTDLSLLDSCTKYKDYIELCEANGITNLGFSEHGNIYNWVSKAMHCHKKGIKYLHSCEMYLTETHEEKVRDNYHTILISKNKEGEKELNKLIDLSTQKDHMYYKNRISFDEFLNISDNIIKISACLASPLSRLSDTHEYYDKLAKHYDYYEIQYHNCKDQIEYNKRLYKLSLKNNIPLIAGTDTHSSTKYKAECRTIKQLSKGIEFDTEDEFDLTFKTYDELVSEFEKQNSLPMDIILDAIENTNVMADSCDKVELDLSYKYPVLSENDEETLKDRINKMYLDKVKKGIIDNDTKYLDDIKEEFRVLKKIGMLSFMLFMSEMIEWCESNGIPVCPCRGSVGGSVVAYILNITDVNPIRWKTVFSRFANEDRVEIGDIDVDFSPNQRHLVYQYIIDRFGIDNSAYILAIGTVADKGCIDDIGRALKYPLSKVSQIKKEYESAPDKAKEKYSELFYYFDGIVGTVVSQSMHPAGMVAAPITLHDNYGTFWKDGKRILQIDMEDVHEVNLVKYDILGLKNIGIIKDACKLANIEYPKAHNVNFDDDNVWNDMISSPVGIFQFEGSYAFDLLKQFKPTKVNDLSLVNASLRPSGESYRDRLINREPNRNPSELIDNLLADNNNYLVFQEDTIAFLKDICGLSGSEADNIRRAIGRKQKDRLDKAMPSILEGYCSKSDKPRHISEKEAKEFLDIIENSSNYQFGKNHSTGYSIIGYYCAMLRYYYPLEFITSFLNNANNEEDIKNGEELAKLKGIKLENPKFRYSKSEYFPDKSTNKIYKGIESIKFLNATVGEYLYSLRDNAYNTFTELLIDLKGHINSKQLEILIKLDFFSEFGKTYKLLQAKDNFDNIYSKKQFKKDKFDTDTLIAISTFAKNETEKMYKDVDTFELCCYLEDNLEDKHISIQERIKNQIEHTGSSNITSSDAPGSACIVTSIDTTYAPKIDLYNLRSGNTKQFKMKSKLFNSNPFEQFDLINIKLIGKEPKKKRVETGELDKNGKPKYKYIPTDIMEDWLYEYELN